MTTRRKPTHAEIIDSAEHFYKLPVTRDRQFIITMSTTCQKDHWPEPWSSAGPDYTRHVWCPLAHVDRPAGSLFWCPCPCHSLEAPASGRADASS